MSPERKTFATRNPLQQIRIRKQCVGTIISGVLAEAVEVIFDRTAEVLAECHPGITEVGRELSIGISGRS